MLGWRRRKGGVGFEEGLGGSKVVIFAYEDWVTL